MLHLETKAGFPKWGRLVGGQYNASKMAKNCMKITKSTFLGRQGGGDMGEQANFLSSVGGFPQSFFSLRFFILLRMCSESNKSEHLLKCNRLHYIAILSKS